MCLPWYNMMKREEKKKKKRHNICHLETLLSKAPKRAVSIHFFSMGDPSGN